VEHVLKVLVMELERLSNGLGHLVGAACGPGRREAITGSISYATDKFHVGVIRPDILR